MPEYVITLKDGQFWVVHGDELMVAAIASHAPDIVSVKRVDKVTTT